MLTTVVIVVVATLGALKAWAVLDDRRFLREREHLRKVALEQEAKEDKCL